MLPIYGRELAQFPISLLFFPDSHISMSLLGLSLPSQWIWISEDQALERQRAPAAPTSPHPSLYPSSLFIPLFLFIPCLAWLGDILTLPVGFDLASSRDFGDGGILLFFIYIQAFNFWFCTWDDRSTIYVIRLIQLLEQVVFYRWKYGVLIGKTQNGWCRPPWLSNHWVCLLEQVYMSRTFTQTCLAIQAFLRRSEPGHSELNYSESHRRPWFPLEPPSRTTGCNWTLQGHPELPESLSRTLAKGLKNDLSLVGPPGSTKTLSILAGPYSWKAFRDPLKP